MGSAERPLEEVLHGGVGNAGLVVRVGDETHRPAGDHSPTVHALLAHVRATGFDGAEVICHNDVCPENVVYRDGLAVALLDFDFAAPGRRIFDLASLARMWLPTDRAELVDVLGGQMHNGGAFVQRRVDAGDVAFTEMWNQMGGAERYRRREEWFDANRQQFLDVLE
jgi:thiamine kinase-like enzyme